MKLRIDTVEDFLKALRFKQNEIGSEIVNHLARFIYESYDVIGNYINEDHIVDYYQSVYSLKASEVAIIFNGLYEEEATMMQFEVCKNFSHSTSSLIATLKESFENDNFTEKEELFIKSYLLMVEQMKYKSNLDVEQQEAEDRLDTLTSILENILRSIDEVQDQIEEIKSMRGKL